MIIWLASYPRSGNTYLRVVLKHLFDLQTYSLYDDVNAIKRDQKTAQVVGHESLPEDFDLDQASQDPTRTWCIKTHGPPLDQSKAIYVVRDGREVTVSYTRYLRNFAEVAADPTDVIVGAVPFGSWSQHLDSWRPVERPNTHLVSFEALVQNPQDTARNLAKFLGKPMDDKALPSFEDLHQINPTFFRSGKQDSWKSTLTDHEKRLFAAIHGGSLQKYGYPVETAAMDPAELMESVAQGFQRLSGWLGSTLDQHHATVAERNRTIHLLQAGMEKQKDRIREQKDNQQQLREKMAVRAKKLKSEIKTLGNDIKEERNQAQSKKQELREIIQKLRFEKQELQARISQVERSWSWRMTSPLRTIRDKLPGSATEMAHPARSGHKSPATAEEELET